MSTAWKVAAATAVVGWFISPVISLLLPKILSSLEFDVEKKLRELQIHIIPELETTLLAVDQERMLERGKKPKSVVSTLDDMARWLRHAREDAEDIFDDAQHKIIAGDILYGAMKVCIARFNSCCQWIAGIVRVGSARLLQLSVDCLEVLHSSLSRRLPLAPVPVTTDIPGSCEPGAVTIDIPVSGEQAVLMATDGPDPVTTDIPVSHRPGTVSIDHPVSDEQAVLMSRDRPDPVTTEIPGSHELGRVTIDNPVSDEQAVLMATNELVPVATPSYSPSDEPDLMTASSRVSCNSSDSSDADEQSVPEATPLASYAWCLSCMCSSFKLFKNSYRLIFYWLVNTARGANSCQDNVLGISSNQKNDTILDCVLTAISRQNLKQRIEKVESTISEVKKSALVGIASSSVLTDIANKNRSNIRTSSNRKVFGREVLRRSIMEKLREKPHGAGPCYSVIGIYGVAGSGKTTFARYIRDFIKEGCKEKLFDTIMCIHVSENFSVDDIFHEMLKDITKDEHSEILDRGDLQEKLKKSLRGKRFFLILDDIWVKTKNDPGLEELISPLNVGLNGSKILVTARTKVAVGALCTDEPIKMPDLDENQYLSMFMHYALGGTRVTDGEFIRVGTVIAEKLHGSPIAAVIVAGRLGANRDIRFWKYTAESDMLNDTMDVLWWSYQQLSPDIKRCFEYCNIFPRRFKLKKSDLFHLWIAQGFVKTSCAVEDLENVAEGYIQELVSCSFLQPEKTWCDQERFSIHDLLHDLVEMVSGTDFFRIENKHSWRGEGQKGYVPRNIPRGVRHLFVENYDPNLIIEETLGLRNLRTIIIKSVGRYTQVEEEFIDNICKKLLKLRVLAFDLSNAQIGKVLVPESVCQLKYLRYLAFRTFIFCKITLPGTLNKLQHIQLLDFGQGYNLEFTFGELVNLRHIICKAPVNLPYVGSLRSLQTLPGFKVSDEQGCELKQLGNLNKLRGKLYISGLENVKSKEQALEANLATKKLTELTLRWGYYHDCALFLSRSGSPGHNDTRCNPEVQADVLDGLCPTVGLTKLELYNFVGWMHLDWMQGKNNGGPKYLQELYLWKCGDPVPPSGLAHVFPNLRVLSLQECSWDALPDNMEHFTSLNNLMIMHCDNIRSLPTLPQSLEFFQLGCCDHAFGKSCQTFGHPNWQKIEHVLEKCFC